MCVCICACMGKGLYNLVNKYVCVFVCVYMCMDGGEWLHDTLYVPVNKYTQYHAHTHTHTHTHTHVCHSANFYTQVVHTHIPEVHDE